jgi:hypothetical protein
MAPALARRERPESLSTCCPDGWSGELRDPCKSRLAGSPFGMRAGTATCCRAVAPFKSLCRPRSSFGGGGSKRGSPAEARRTAAIIRFVSECLVRRFIGI